MQRLQARIFPLAAPLPLSGPSARAVMDSSSSAPVRRLSAVWFADIVGFTTLAGTDEGTAFRLVTTLQKVSRRIAEEEYGGRVVKFIGDAVLAEFKSTDAAVRAAIALQVTFDEEANAIGHPAELRIGVHLGEVIATADGDIYGDGVNTASRLQGEAEPGKVLISEDVWRQLRTRPEFRFQSLGEVELRGITARVAVFDVLFGARAALAHAKAAAEARVVPEGKPSAGPRSAALPQPAPARSRRAAVWGVVGLLLAGGGAAGVYFGALRPPSADTGPTSLPPGEGASGQTLAERARNNAEQGPPARGAAAAPATSGRDGATESPAPAGRGTPPASQGAVRSQGEASRIAAQPDAGAGAGRPTAPGPERGAEAGRGAASEIQRPPVETPAAPPRPADPVAAEPAPYVADPMRERELAVAQAVSALDSLVRVVERKSMAELARAFPLRAAELTQFEQLFQRAAGPIQASVLSPSVRRIDLAGAELWFFVSMQFTDQQGVAGSMPLPLRAYVARSALGWRIETVGLRN